MGLNYFKVKHKINIAYLIVSRSYPGIVKQIEYDYQLTRNIKELNWKNFTFLDQIEKNSHSKKLPFLFRGVFGRRLFLWMWLLKNSKDFDFVIMRHMEFDSFSLIFSWVVPNRIHIHHSNEIVELKLRRNNWKGKIASKVEKITGGVAIRNSSAILTVSKDLMHYQRNARKLPKDFPIFHFPNGIIVENTPILKDVVNNNSVIEVGFIAAQFHPWHGLDLLIDSCNNFLRKDINKILVFHLIGKLDSNYLDQIKIINQSNNKIKFKVYGTLKQQEYWEIFCNCNIGIGSLAMYRNGLTDGCTLKVREMLAMGLPIFSGHKDTALPDDFPYYFSEGGNIEDMIEFSRKVANVTRKEVRDASFKYIEKSICFKLLAKDLQKLYRIKKFKKLKNKNQK